MPKKRPARPRTAAAVAKLAARQYGVIGVRQLYSLGLSARQLRHRVASGWLPRLPRGGYAVGPGHLTRHGCGMASVLSGGEGAVLSHQAAAELWKLRQRRSAIPTAVDISLPPRRGPRARSGLVVHRAQPLRSAEVTVREGIPVTSAPRTILDLATFLPRRQLERAIDEAERLTLCTEDDLDEVVSAHFGGAGTGALRALLREHRAGSPAPRTDFDEGFLSLCRKRHLPQPE